MELLVVNYEIVVKMNKFKIIWFSFQFIKGLRKTDNPPKHVKKYEKKSKNLSM